MTLIVHNCYQTTPNSFGLWKEYLYQPSYDPDAFISPKDLHRPHTSTIVPDEEEKLEATSKFGSVYHNKIMELLLDWQNSGSSTKSNEELNQLVHTILLYLKSWLHALWNFNATHENQKADAAEEKSSFLQSFCHALVDIDVPSGSSHMAS
jgi:hypothetical protein